MGPMCLNEFGFTQFVSNKAYNKNVEMKDLAKKSYFLLLSHTGSTKRNLSYFSIVVHLPIKGKNARFVMLLI